MEQVQRMSETTNSILLKVESQLSKRHVFDQGLAKNFVKKQIVNILRVIKGLLQLLNSTSPVGRK